MALLDEIKLNLRISSDVFDDAEITPLIEACKADLKIAGVQKWDDNDPLCKRAAVNYCKAHFGFDDKADRYINIYEHLKIVMSLSSDYNGGAENAE